MRARPPKHPQLRACRSVRLTKSSSRPSAARLLAQRSVIGDADERHRAVLFRQGFAHRIDGDLSEIRPRLRPPCLDALSPPGPFEEPQHGTRVRAPRHLDSPMELACNLLLTQLGRVQSSRDQEEMFGRTLASPDSELTARL